MITITKADGTVLALDVPMQCVAEMSDKNTAREAIAEWMSAVGASKLQFNNPIGGSVERINRNMDIKSAIAAATDYLLYQKYDHPLTTQGLHIYADADLGQMTANQVGFVRSSYVGNALNAPSMVDGKHVWHVIGLQLGEFVTNPARIKNAIQKHIFVEYLVRGHSLNVWIAPIRDFVATFIVQWLCDDVDEAKAYRDSRIKASQLNRREIRPAGASAWKTLQSAVQVGESVELPTEINVPTVDGEVVNLMELTEDTGIKLYKEGYVTTMTFKPSEPKSLLTFQNLFGEESKYSVKLLV